ncbi:thioesterase II family protein [Mailhella massiliensis]|uniref:thioesterase II family protein n=1 Tax=Mailhella massiliensis TaxID=1903261 RepID=UPI00138FF1F8|nr:alpha/beta fold hydrolase [Mailhella massiliensis]
MLNSEESLSWVRFFRQAPDERVRLFCFPFAGGGASAFLPWKKLLPDYISLVPVQLPGHEDRFEEKAIMNAERMYEAMYEGLRPYFSSAMAFFGHSMGGLLAFQFARYLLRRGETPPVHLFLSAAPVPVRPPEMTGRPSEEEEFLRRILQSGTVPESVLLDEESLQIVKRTLLSDHELLLSLLDGRTEPLAVPVTVMAGERDLLVPLERARAWQDFTSRSCSILTWPGGHFYVRRWLDDVVAVIDQSLLMYVL